jgi:ADP-ribose pyrophosphatase
MPPLWNRLSSRVLGDHHIFTLLTERFVSPRNGLAIDAIIVQPADWVNVLAFTEADECVMIRQYRFGTDAIQLEIPGGIIDPGELPLTAAARELREETGYASSRWTALGSVAPNPAFQRNRLHTFLAEGCVHVSEQEQEATEDIDVELMPAPQLATLLADGSIDHALVLVGFYKLALHRGQNNV